MHHRARGAVVLILAGLSCSKPPAAPSTAAAAPSAQTAPSAQAAPAAPSSTVAPAVCGPAVEDQVDAVRIAVLEELMARAVREAAAGGAPVGQVVIAEEQRMKPSGQIFVHDASAAVAAHFSGRTPPVENYSTAFLMQQGKTVRKENQTAFSTGEICWSGTTRAVVPVRILTGSGNRPGTAAVERSGAAWTVTAVEMRR